MDLGGQRFEAAVTGSSLGPVFFLPGDFYPKHRRVEAELELRLRQDFSRWISAEESLASAGGTFTVDLPDRLACLERQVLACADPARVVLIGLSSGARVATLLSRQIGVAATIALSYPFRHPGRTVEAARFEHLHRLTVPTLIIQGVRDQYGGLSFTEDYALSPAVSVKFVDCGHAMHLPPAQWDDIAGTIRHFCTATSAHPAEKTFDEVYYRQVHPDVDAAVRRGRYASAADHYRKLGWKEKRRFRVVVP